MPKDDGNPLDALENINIEGILDEALRLEEAENGPELAASRPRSTSKPPAEDESMFSGLLDEALGSQETESILDSVLGVSLPESPRTTGLQRDQSDPMREIEAELLGDRLEPVEEEDQGPPHLSELIMTRISVPKDKHSSSQSVKAVKPVNAVKETSKSKAPIEVPITLHIDADAFEQDIELLLKIRLKRK